MKSSYDISNFELLCVIINFGVASKVIKHARKFGITGGTIFLGKGTIKNHFWKCLCLNEVRREIVLMVADRDTANNTLDELYNKFRFDKPHHGIAFSTSVLNVLGAKSLTGKEQDYEKSRGVEIPMYNLITVVVDRGKGEFVVEAANNAGSKGATIVNARGSGIHETSKLFDMEIEPEKEVVLIISQTNLTEPIVSSIMENLKIDKPGNGIIFIQDINKTYGLY